MKKTVFFLIFSLFFAAEATVVRAQLIDYSRRGKTAAQKDEGGTEKSKYTPSLPRTMSLTESKDVPEWVKDTPKVSNRYERRYDINRDGWLQTAEVKIYLRDVIEKVEEDGRFTVNSDILKPYDKNKDGIISSSEVKEVIRDSGF